MKYKAFCPRCKIYRFFSYNLAIEIHMASLPEKLDLFSFCNECYFNSIEKDVPRDRVLDLIKQEKQRLKREHEFNTRIIKPEKTLWNLWGLLP